MVGEPEAQQQLQVLIANEQPARIEQLEAIVRSLGHEVVARDATIGHIGRLTREHRPDVALVGLGGSNEHALELIGKIVHEAACPVIAVLHAPNPAFVRAAARRGVFAYVDRDGPEEYESAIAIVLERFSAFRNLEGAFGRRALIERAKGILMERHQLTERQAFELLRRHSHHTGRKLTDIATALTETHLLLPARTPDPPADDPAAG